MTTSLPGAALAACLLALAAGPAAAEFRQIDGEATYDERLALPAEAVLEVQLLELAGGGATPVPIASIAVRVLGNKPYPFRLTFDDAMIDGSRTYALASRLRMGEETLFRTAEAVPMFSSAAVSGPPTIRMVRAEPAGAEPGPGLAGSRWRVVELPGGELAGEARADIRFGEDNQFNGTGGCNDFRSSYRLDPPEGVSFGRLAVTLRGCSGKVAQQERLVVRALGRTAKYRVEDDGTLVLMDAEDAELLRLIRMDV